MRSDRQTKNEHLQQLAETYRKAGQEWPASAKMIAAWAIREKLWQPQPRSMLRQCARELAEALRAEYYTDPQGRRVRTKHAIKDVREEQLVLWVDVFDASPEQMQAAFQLRRHQIVGDCKQLKADVDSYNENQNRGDAIQMVFDFRYDLEELEQAAMAQ